MSDSIVDEENNNFDDIAESVSKSYDSKSKIKSCNNLGSNNIYIYKFNIL